MRRNANDDASAVGTAGISKGRGVSKIRGVRGGRTSRLSGEVTSYVELKEW